MDQVLLSRVKASLPFLIILLLPIAFYLTPYLQAKRLHISRESVGEAWPFTFDEGTLSCLKPRLLIVTDTETKTTYALNYDTLLMASGKNWKSVEEALLPSALAPSSKQSLHSIQQQALSLCTCSMLDFRPQCSNDELLSTGSKKKGKARPLSPSSSTDFTRRIFPA